MNSQNLSSFIWSVADLLRGDYKQSEYGKVILPFTVLRRLDCVLEPTKAAVLAELDKREKAGLNPEPFLLRKSGQLFYNTSPLDLKKLMGDQDHIGENLARLHAGVLARRARHLRAASTSTPRSTGSPRPACSTSSPRSSPTSTCTPRSSATPQMGARLRGADPQVRRAVQRDRRRALHPARGHPADGEPAVHRGRRRADQARRRALASTTPPPAPAACCRRRRAPRRA